MKFLMPGRLHMKPTNKKDYARFLLDRLHQEIDRPITVMEVCGTHTVAIARNGLRDLLPEGMTLLSGPGCPVCVTDDLDLDSVMALARQEDHDATFGDMMCSRNRAVCCRRRAGCRCKGCFTPLQMPCSCRRKPRKDWYFWSALRLLFRVVAAAPGTGGTTRLVIFLFIQYTNWCLRSCGFCSMIQRSRSMPF